MHGGLWLALRALWRKKRGLTGRPRQPLSLEMTPVEAGGRYRPRLP